jgi:hypothetical protein
MTAASTSKHHNKRPFKYRENTALELRAVFYIQPLVIARVIHNPDKKIS